MQASSSHYVVMPHSVLDPIGDWFEVVEEGDMHKIQAWLAKGCSLNDANPQRITGLMRACYFQRKSVLKCCEDKTVQVHRQDEDGWTALHWWVESYRGLRNANGECLDAWTLKGEGLEHQWNRLQLDNALWIGEWLLRKGADVHVKNDAGASPWNWLVQYGLKRAQTMVLHYEACQENQRLQEVGQEANVCHVKNGLPKEDKHDHATRL